MADVLDQMQQEAHGDQRFVRMALLFKPAGTGVELKEEAMQKVLGSRTAQQYRGLLEHSLFSFQPGDTFTVENLRAIVGNPPEGVSYNVMGAAMNSMARKGLIEFTGRMKPAQRVSLHASLLSEWRLVKYPERA